MQATINFIVPESLKSVCAGAGIRGAGESFIECPLSVGDYVSWPSAPGLHFRVTFRLYHAGPVGQLGEWHLGLVQATNPIDTLDAP